MAPFSIKVTDSSTGVGAPFSASNSYTLAVAAPVLTLTPARIGARLAGGIAPYAYSVSGGAWFTCRVNACCTVNWCASFACKVKL
ncbi:hypothetical protein JAB1_46340 [Janthinobacterium sp. MP5059B]|nr:hypothetical protein JAB1_46340 [Janthinobacterium sp. MP5059B]